MGLFRKRDERFRHYLLKLLCIKEKLDEDGGSDGECRYKVFVAMFLLFIEQGLRRIGVALFCMLGFEIGKFVFRLLLYAAAMITNGL